MSDIFTPMRFVYERANLPESAWSALVLYLNMLQNLGTAQIEEHTVDRIVIVTIPPPKPKEVSDGKES